MLVDNNVYRNSYVANGSTTRFAISFPFLESSHVIVYKKVRGTESVVNSSEYTISGVGQQNGGTLTFNTAPAKGTIITILRNVPITQLHKYTELDNFPAESHENALAKLTMICQQLMELSSRHLTVPPTATETPQEVMRQLLDIAKTAEKYAQMAKETYDAAVELKNVVNDLVIQTGDEQVVRIENTGNAQVTLVENEGQAQLDRLAGYADIAALAEGLACARQTWTLTKDAPSGTEITLPNEMFY